MAFHFRYIRSNGKIKYKHRWWCTTGDVSHLKGKRMVFNDYEPSEPDLLCLWGTLAFYHCKDPDSPYGEKCWTELCKLMGIRESNNKLSVIGGISYRSRGIEWWRPCGVEMQGEGG